MSTTWAPVTFYEIRVGDTVRSLDHRTGEVIANGQVDHIVHCKDHDRAVNHTLGLLARSEGEPRAHQHRPSRPSCPDRLLLRPGPLPLLRRRHAPQ